MHAFYVKNMQQAPCGIWDSLPGVTLALDDHVGLVDCIMVLQQQSGPGGQFDQWMLTG